MRPRSVYSDDHETFRESVREFVRRDVEPHLEDFASGKGLTRELWRAAGAQGFLGLEVPEEHGGTAAGDYRFNAVLLEELAKVSLALASSLSIHFDVVAPYVVGLATKEQQAAWLPGLVSGDLVTAIGMTEPSAGSDLAALRTTAVADEARGGWVVNGSKIFITNGGSADLVLVAARTIPGTRGRGIPCWASRRPCRGSSAGACSTRSVSPRPTPPSFSSRTSMFRPATSSVSATQGLVT